MRGRGWGRSGLRGRGGRRRAVRMLLPLLLAAVFMLLEAAFAPPLLAAAQEQARARALTALTEAAGRQIEKNGADDYRELVWIERDENGRAALLLPNTPLYNALIHDITLDAAAALEQLSRQKLRLPAGIATGSALLSGLGPDIPFRIRVLGTPDVRVEDDLTAAGINQVRHRVWLDISAEIRVLAPFSRETAEVHAVVLLAEGLIVGYVPDAYLGLDSGESGR